MLFFSQEKVKLDKQVIMKNSLDKLLFNDSATTCNHFLFLYLIYRVSAAEISELRSLVRSISLSRDQSNEVLSQTLALANKLDKAIQQVNQLAKQ